MAPATAEEKKEQEKGKEEEEKSMNIRARNTGIRKHFKAPASEQEEYEEYEELM